MKIRSTPGMACAGRSIDRQNLRARVRTQQRRGVQHSRHAHVVDERFFAQRLFEAQISRGRLADSVALVTVLCGSGEAEFFAKVRMPPRLVRLGAALPCAPGLARGLDGVHDARVARAAAKMRVQGFCHRFAILRAAVLQQSRSANHDARDAEAALDRALEQKCLAQNTTHVFRHAFERHYVMAGHVFRFTQAGEHWLAVN